MDHHLLKLLAICKNEDEINMLENRMKKMCPEVSFFSGRTEEEILELSMEHDPGRNGHDVVLHEHDLLRMFRNVKDERHPGRIPVLFMLKLMTGLDTPAMLPGSNGNSFPGLTAVKKEPASTTDAMVNGMLPGPVHDTGNKQSETLFEERTRELKETYIAAMNLLEDITRENDARKKSEQSLRESREQLRIFAGHLHTIREEQRVSIARELHDNLGQNLSAIKMDICMLIKMIGNQEETAISDQMTRHAQDMIPMIETSINLVRKISEDLRPHLLEELGLVAAIEKYVGEFAKRSGLSCNLIADVSKIKAEKHHAVGIFRIVQEALTNVMRHAGASSVEIRIMKGHESNIIEIEDNGKGMNCGKIESTRSIGILGMRERAILFGGRLTICSSRGKGTKVTLEIPLKTSQR